LISVKRIAQALTAHPLIVLGAFILAALVLGWQAQHFRIDASADTLLTRDNIHYIRTEVMSERFSPQEFVLVAYKPREVELFSQQTYTNLASLTEKLNGLERVESVRSLLNVPLISLMEGDWTEGDPEEWTHEQKNFSNEQLREALTGHPIYEDLLVNQAQTATAIQVLFRPNEELADIRSQITAIQANALERELTRDERDEIEALQERAQPLQDKLNEQRVREIDAIRDIIAYYESDANLYLGGAHVLGYQLIEIIQNDLVLFGALIAAMICVVLYVLFGGFRWVLIPVICCSFSVLFTVGLFGMLGLRTTVISSNFIALQLILTLAIVVHLIVQYREFSAAQPDWSQRALIEAAFVKKAAPCFYAGMTTSVGFASLLFTGLQPVISFGWMMIIAMSFSLLVSLVLFPALLALFPREGTKGHRRPAYWVLSGTNALTQRWRGLVLLGSSAALVLGIAGMLRLDVENSFIEYFSEDTDVHRELTFIDQELGGSTPLDITLDLPKTDQQELIITAEAVQMTQRVQEMLQELEGMGKLLSVVNFTQLARDIRGMPLTEYELTAAYRIIDEELREELVGSYFSEDHSQLRISARIQDATEGLNRAELMAEIRAGMKELGLSSDDYQLTNLFVLYQDMMQRLFRSQVMSLGLVYAALALTFLVIFGSFRTAGIALAPNLLSTVGVLGTMGWLNIPLDLMTITIASIAMGIGVDNTIHYIHRYRQELVHNSSADALRHTTFSVGFAILFTTLIIILGFSQLGFSDFVPSAQFGLLSSLAMFLAVLWNLTLLPVLLGMFVTSSKKGTRAKDV
jgi:uncharacterized protein